MDKAGTTPGERKRGIPYGIGVPHRLIAAVAAVVAGGMLALAGCASGGDTSPDALTQSGSPSSSAPPAAADDDAQDDATPDTSTRSGTPGSSGLPAAADGTDLSACVDGRCEVRVGAAARLPVPRRLRVASVRVQSVGFDTVTVVGRYLGYSQRGFCTGVSCNSSSSDGRFRLVLAADSTATENGLSITAVAVNGESAVLRLTPE
ncbi:hypothetical protein [Nonomuraea helvata]|uniref:Uncharacterized protein n=1 Tax=Nonomuraea helvata TaxID=37484 RepID=A0ABV5RT66_9ACTN